MPHQTLLIIQYPYLGQLQCSNSYGSNRDLQLLSKALSGLVPIDIYKRHRKQYLHIRKLGKRSVYLFKAESCQLYRGR